MLLFERDEYLERVGRAKRAMQARGLDVLLVASPANQFWLTGYDGWSFYTPQMVVVSLDREEPVWIGRKMDAVGAKFTAFLAPENVVPYPDYYVGSDSHHPLDFVADFLVENGLDKGHVGVETDDYYYTAKWDHILRARLPNATFHDAFLLVNYANPDMVGHTGVLEAAIKAVETVDACAGRLVEAIVAKGGVACVTADHGNCDRMIALYTGKPHTYHTTQPVAFFVIGHDGYLNLRPRGILADVAPTLLALLGIDQPEEMLGMSLIETSGK